MKIIKRIIILVCLLAIFMGGYLFVNYRTDTSVGKADEAKVVVVAKGDSVDEVAEKLEEQELISRQLYFIYYVWTHNIENKIIAGEYEIAPGLKIAEIAEILIKGEVKPAYVKVTFPEGWTAEQMAERLDGKNLPGGEFLEITMDPPAEIKNGFDFLKDIPSGASLEGFLFPDTYFFAQEASAEDIVGKMLENFDLKFNQDLRYRIAVQNKDPFEMITMASIIESEVKTEEDRKIVSGIFWNRLGIGMALQSDATVSYGLGGEKKIQHDANDIDSDSPYNTYKFRGLPPGPVSNPGISSIRAAIDPTDSDYIYFLNNPKTGKTFFSVTFEEHVANKAANGL